MKEITIIFFDENDNALSKANYDRWNKLPWYKRLFGYFFYSYKRKFIDMEGFECGMDFGSEAGDSQVEVLLDDKLHIIENPKLMDDWFKLISKERKKLTNNELEEKAIKEGRQYVNAFFEILNSKDTEPIERYLENLPEYKKIIDDSPDKFLDFYFQDSIRDEQYELSQYISDVAKKRGMILKAEV